MNAMSGRGELGDRGLEENLYGLGGLDEIHDWADWTIYMTGRTRADGADSRADGADWCATMLSCEQ